MTWKPDTPPEMVRALELLSIWLELGQAKTPNPGWIFNANVMTRALLDEYRTAPGAAEVVKAESGTRKIITRAKFPAPTYAKIPPGTPPFDA